MDSNEINRQFEEAYRLYVKAIFRFAYFKTSDNESALDIAQDTFLRYWKILTAGHNIKDPKAFLYFIAYGLVVDFYRKKKHRAHVPLENIDEGLIFIVDDLENKMDDKNQIDFVLSKLRKLKDEYRDALLLYYIEDLPVADIARMLNKNENNVRVLIHRALKDLKGKL